MSKLLYLDLYCIMQVAPLVIILAVLEKCVKALICSICGVLCIEHLHFKLPFISKNDSSVATPNQFTTFDNQTKHSSEYWENYERQALSKPSSASAEGFAMLDKLNKG